MSALERESQPRQLTFILSGADVYQASCPELEISYYSEDADEAKRGLSSALSAKATAIVNCNGTFPFRELEPYARLFVNNADKVRKALMEGNPILVNNEQK